MVVRVWIKKINFLGIKIFYFYWDFIRRILVVSDDFIIIFGGGVVFIKVMFCERDINDDVFLELVFIVDDFWYLKFLVLNKNMVFVVFFILDELNFI